MNELDQLKAAIAEKSFQTRLEVKDIFQTLNIDAILEGNLCLDTLPRKSAHKSTEQSSVKVIFEADSDTINRQRKEM